MDHIVFGKQDTDYYICSDKEEPLFFLADPDPSKLMQKLSEMLLGDAEINNSHI